MKSWGARLFVLVAVIAIVATPWGRQGRRASGAGGFSLSSLAGIYAFHFQGVKSGGRITLPTAGGFIVVPLISCPPGNPILGPTGLACLVLLPATFPVTLPIEITGQFMADGGGHIPTGSGVSNQNDIALGLDTAHGLTYSATSGSCGFNLTGTDSVNADGSGTMTLIASGPCLGPTGGGGSVTATFHFLLADVDQGAANFGVAFSAPIPDGTPGDFPTSLGGSFGRQF